MNNVNRHSELLQKLFNGNISDKERWELERASLDDAFLSDALEGYYNNSEQHETKFINDFKGTPSKERRLFKTYKWVSVAASFLIMLSLSYWSFHKLNKGKELDQVTEVREVGRESKVESLESEIDLQLNDNSASDNENEQLISFKEEPSKLHETHKKTKAIKEEATLDVEDAPMASPINIKKEKRVASPVTQSRGMMVEEVAPLRKRTITGVVKDALGEPITAASIQSQRGSGPVYTDSSGSFQISLQQDDDFVIAEAIGFSSQKLKAKPNLNIKLEATRDKLSESPKLLAEMMDDNQLKTYYTKKMESHFKQSPVPFCNEELKKLKKIKINISILKSNRVNNISFYQSINEACKAAIESEIHKLSLNSFFDGSKVVQFDFSLFII